MLDDENTSPTPAADEGTASSTTTTTRRRRAASRPAGPPAAEDAAAPQTQAAEPVQDAAATPAPTTKARTSTRRTSKKATSASQKASAPTAEQGASADTAAEAEPAVEEKPRKRATGRARKAATSEEEAPQPSASEAAERTAPFAPLFKAPEPVVAAPEETPAAAETDDEPEAESDRGTSGRRRRSRGGRKRRRSEEGTEDETTPADRADKGGADKGSGGKKRDDKGGDDAGTSTDGEGDKGDKAEKGDKPEKGDKKKGSGRKQSSSARQGKQDTSGDDAKAAKADNREAAEKAGEGEDSKSTSSRRRRRRRRGGDGDAEAKGREDAATESITGVEGSTRIEAKRQRRREGREAGRRRAPILSESEFLARRESVERVMAIRQHGEITQIAVLEDNVLVEHYVAVESQTSMIGNVYLGRVQNVLPSMEAAFIDIGKGRNAVLYAGEVNWDLAPDKNAPRRIENALKPGQAVLVQVTKDPVGHKGARLTSQISLPGRFLVYVPGGGTSGISRKLPDTERNRLKNVLKEILPDDAGVIIRTAAEGASEDELTRDVMRLTARWEDIEKKSKNGQAPQALYTEPDTTLRVVRDLFTEDFSKLVISGDDAWDMVDGYVQYVAPDLAERLERFDGEGDVFASYRVDEQIAKALERKVWLPSGGSLVIDRTEAMTVIDVNTGKFTGSGGNLEETVTKNNLEAAEEIVRQLRLRDIGGIIVVDFIDMVLESNRDLVLRRLVECLGRDRTRHQVAEVTSLGLVQMTRKRIGTGLVEAFSHPCEHCQGRGVVIESEPVIGRKSDDDGQGRGSRGGKRSSNRRRTSKKATASDDTTSPDTGSGGDTGQDSGAADRPSDRSGSKEPAAS